MELWFVSSSSCFPLCTCQVQHTHQGRNFQRFGLKFTGTNPLCREDEYTHTTRTPSMEGDSVLCNTLPQSASTDQLRCFCFKVVLSDLQVCNAAYVSICSLSVDSLTVNKSTTKATKNMSNTDLVSLAVKKAIFPTHPNYFAIQDDLSCFTFTFQWMESVISVVTSNWAHYWLQLFWMPTTHTADDFGSNSEKYLHKS